MEFDIEIRNEKFTLLSQKAVLWKSKSILFLSDLHLGKAQHFRKEGIGIPEAIGEEDYTRLYKLFSDYPTDHVYFLGDLFHSEYNREWSRVKEMISHFSPTQFHLVIGNHDILSSEDYDSSGIHIVGKTHQINSIKFTHEPPEKEYSEYIFCGHIHPGVSIKGRGRQYLRLPCFYFTENFMILPAFGTFTGVKTLNVSGNRKAFAVVKDKIVQIQ